MMTDMTRNRLWPSLGLALAAVIVIGAADAEAAPKTTFVFDVYKVKLRGTFPAKVEAAVREQLAKQIASNPRLVAEVPEGAPSPKTDPKGFTAWMTKRKLRAFKINVEVTEYEQRVEDAPGSKRGKMIVARIALRIFGETVPDRSMAFTGDGSATIKIGVGSRVRDRDKKVADRESSELAVADAIAMSIKKLDSGAAKKKKKKRRR